MDTQTETRLGYVGGLGRDVVPRRYGERIRQTREGRGRLSGYYWSIDSNETLLRLDAW